MALTLTVAQLSQAVRLTVTGSPPPPYLAIVTRQLAVAQAIIEEYVNDDAPDDVKNEAAIMMVGYLLEAPPASRTQVDVFSRCGAKAILSRWHDLGSAVVEVS